MTYPPPVQPPLRYKDPASILDFGFDLAKGDNPWLLPDETVATLTVTPDDGLTVQSQNIGPNADKIPGSQIVAWLMGGAVGMTYAVKFAWVTSLGRADARTMRIKVMTR